MLTVIIIKNKNKNDTHVQSVSVSLVTMSNHDEGTKYDSVVVKMGDNENVVVTSIVVSSFSCRVLTIPISIIEYLGDFPRVLKSVSA